ncbi:histidine kinase [Streptomyces sp. NPDC049967]|uniref:sensor histidine kinase n=1 Tax=unclassified Streptomyces TaxID=2593676 RepID=UPI00342A2B2D
MDAALDAEDFPPRIAGGMLWAALFLLFVVRALSWVIEGVSPLSMALTSLSYPPLIALLLARRWPRCTRYGLLAALVVLALLPFAVVGTHWNWLPWTIVAGVLCVLPAAAAWPLAGLVVVATAVGGIVAGEPAVSWFSRVMATGTDALIIFSLYTITGMITELHSTRGEMARLATVRERLRVDGELREAVGGQLRTIADGLARAKSAVGAVEAAPATAAVHLQRTVEIARITMSGIRTTASGYRTVEVPSPLLLRSPRLVRGVLLGVLVLQTAKTLVTTDGPSQGDPRWLVLFVPLLGLAVALLMMAPSGVRLALVGVLVVPLAFPGAFLNPAWIAFGGLWGFLIGAAWAWLRPSLAGAVTATVVGLHVVLGYYPPPVASLPQLSAALISDVILAGLFYSLTRLGDLLVLLDRAQRELALSAVSEERTRIARDLHDVLGFSLSAVALRGELALRMLDRRPERATAELGLLADLVGQARTELGSIAGGRVRLFLHREIEAALGVLAAAGVAASTDVTTTEGGLAAFTQAGPLPAGVDTALAAVLRECVTNVLRHSAAHICTISITGDADVIRLRVTNDGVEGSRARSLDVGPQGVLPGQPQGSGLENLAARAGGRLTAGLRSGGVFEVMVEFCSDPAGFGGDADGVDPVAGAQLGNR